MPLRKRSTSITLVLLALGGCTGAPTSSLQADFTVVPQWHVGDSWTFESADEYYSERHTVEAIENIDGNRTYRVATRVRDGTDIFFGTTWIRASDLAATRSQVPVLRADAKLDCGGIFPLENRSITCTTENQGRTTRAPNNITVHEPGPVVTPAGTFEARELRWTDSRTNITQNSKWYAPEVAWLVKFDYGDHVVYLKEFTLA